MCLKTAHCCTKFTANSLKSSTKCVEWMKNPQRKKKALHTSALQNLQQILVPTKFTVTSKCYLLWTIMIQVSSVLIWIHNLQIHPTCFVFIVSKCAMINSEKIINS